MENLVDLPEEPSLADFLYPDGEDPLTPPEGFSTWMENNQWAVSLMEPKLQGAVGPRGEIFRAGTKQQVINLSSYNYLGLATHPEVVEAAHQALSKYGTGACGSPLLSGMADLHEKLEHEIAKWLERGDAMLFNSGFGGGLGSLAGLLRKGDAAILDEKCHLCLIDGAKLSKARLNFFKHNDPESLAQVLEATKGKRRLIVVEGVYSMDGDTAKLDQLMPVALEHGVGVMIDEAHSIGVFGDKGRGVAQHYGYSDQIGLQFATFSKSFAHTGSFLSGNKALLQYVRYYANPYGFSCALPPTIVAGITKALEVATRDDVQRQKVWANTEYFRTQAKSLGLDLGESNSQVIPIIIGEDRRLLFDMGKEMHEKGLFLAPVDYPSVPLDSLRYRVAITAAHERKDLDDALSILEDVVIKRAGKRS